MEFALKAAEFVLGLGVVLTTWAEVFGTVIVPHRLKLGLGLGGHLRRTLHPVWRAVAARGDGQRSHNLLSGFAGALLVLTFVTWMLCLLLGFSLMAYAVGGAFNPPVPTFWEGLTVMSSAMVTLGTNNHLTNTGAGLLVAAAGISGLGVATLTLTYILQVQSGLSQRDSLVLTLPARAGSPPSGVVILQTLGKLELHDKLPQFFLEWEKWCAAVLHSHSAHPVLALFRSTELDDDWLTCLGAVLDAATLASAVMKDGPQQAEFLLRLGARTCIELCKIFDIEPDAQDDVGDRQILAAVRRLRAAGYPIDETVDELSEIRQRRSLYAGHIRGLATTFGVKPPPWLGAADGEELAPV